MTKANAGDQNFGHRHLNILNRYSLCNNPCRSHRHLLVHGSRKDFSRLQYKRCHLLRPDPTSNRHSRHGSKYGLVLIDHRVSRLQHSKEYSDCGKENRMAKSHGGEHPPQRKIQRRCLIAEILYSGFPSEENKDQRGRGSPVLCGA